MEVWTWISRFGDLDVIFWHLSFISDFYMIDNDFIIWSRHRDSRSLYWCRDQIHFSYHRFILGLKLVLTIISNISHLKVYNACVFRQWRLLCEMSQKRAELRNIMGPYLNCVDVWEQARPEDSYELQSWWQIISDFYHEKLPVTYWSSNHPPHLTKLVALLNKTDIYITHSNRTLVGPLLRVGHIPRDRGDYTGRNGRIRSCILMAQL